MTVRRLRTFEPAEVQVGLHDMLRLQVKRLSVGEHAIFERLLTRAVRPEADRMITARRPGEELERDVRSAISETEWGVYHGTASELERQLQTTDDPKTIARAAIGCLAALLEHVTPTERFVIPDGEIRRRRLVEMTDAERATYARLQNEDQAAYEACLAAGLAHIRVEPGQLEVEDVDTQTVTPIEKGEDLRGAIGGDPALCNLILFAIRRANRLSDDEKNGSRSPSTSRPSSTERDQTAPGASPATTASSAAPSASVMTAAATPIAGSRSGRTASSRSRRAPSSA